MADILLDETIARSQSWGIDRACIIKRRARMWKRRRQRWRFLWQLSRAS
ncbi:MAG: hypothetical protein IT360_19415 [Gemmatimonadaceae bacterium]|nr:hypothetical protein [Gemmatimonadaceae bacterium]